MPAMATGGLVSGSPCSRPLDRHRRDRRSLWERQGRGLVRDSVPPVLGQSGCVRQPRRERLDRRVGQHRILPESAESSRTVRVHRLFDAAVLAAPWFCRAPVVATAGGELREEEVFPPRSMRHFLVRLRSGWSPMSPRARRCSNTATNVSYLAPLALISLPLQADE